MKKQGFLWGALFIGASFFSSDLTAQASVFPLNGDNAGIGTNTPAAALHISKANANLRFTDEGGNGDDYMLINNDGSSSVMNFAIFNNTDGRAELAFDGSGNMIKMNGKVGIGVTVPAAHLHVEMAAGKDNKSLQLQDDATNPRQVFFVNDLNASGFNWQSEDGDMGLFWNDHQNGTKNGNAGFVLAPQANSLDGVRIAADGKVSMGLDPTTANLPTGYRLFVMDGILTEKVKVAVNNTAEWSDFVFADDYQLRSLEEVANFVEANNHLPDVPSAEEMVNNGLDVAKTDALLLQKIEELTLYLIEQDKAIKTLQKENELLKNKMK